MGKDNINEIYEKLRNDIINDFEILNKGLNSNNFNNNIVANAIMYTIKKTISIYFDKFIKDGLVLISKNDNDKPIEDFLDLDFVELSKNLDKNFSILEKGLYSKDRNEYHEAFTMIMNINTIINNKIDYYLDNGVIMMKDNEVVKNEKS